MKIFAAVFFGMILSFQVFSKEMTIEQIYERCQMVEDTVEVVVDYRDTGTSREKYLELVNKKMREMGIEINSPTLFGRVRWFIDYIYDRPDKDVYDLKVDIDFLCKSSMMDDGWW